MTDGGAGDDGAADLGEPDEASRHPVVSGLDPLSSSFTWETNWIYERADSGVIDPDTSVVLETPRPLSESGIWSLQRDFFRDHGLNAWVTKSVPQYVTTNRFVADLYAQLLIGWIRDASAAVRRGTSGPSTTRGTRLASDAPDPDTDDPFTVVELGGGSGRFGFHLIDRLLELLDGSELRGTPIRFVMTDVAPSNVDAWQAHPSLAPFVERGVLDFAVFDATAPAPLSLRVSGQTIDRSSSTCRLAVIANYVFSSVPHDCFAIGTEGLREVLVSLVGPADHNPQEGPELLGQLRLEGTWRPVTTVRYPEPSLRNLLSFYAGALGVGTVFTLPVAALRSLEFFRDVAGDDLLVLMIDTGTPRFDDVDRHVLPPIVGHGSFSVPVNFHALGRLTEATGGRMLSASDRQLNVEVIGLQHGRGAHTPNAFGAAYRRAVDEFGPNRFLAMNTAMRPQLRHFTIDQLLAVLRWAHYDSNVLLEMVPAIVELVHDGIDAEARTNLHEVLDRVWRGYYFIGEPEDLAFEIGRILHAAELPAAALVYFDRSQARS